jgi:S1-C subfamily serine protease
VLEYLGDRPNPMPFTGTKKSDENSKQIEPKTERRASTGAMPDFTYSGDGVRIAGVSDDSPAAKANLTKGDVIVEFDGKPVKNLKAYSDFLKEHKPGDTVKLTIDRNGEKKEVSLTLMER